MLSCVMGSGNVQSAIPNWRYTSTSPASMTACEPPCLTTEKAAMPSGIVTFGWSVTVCSPTVTMLGAGDSGRAEPPASVTFSPTSETSITGLCGR